MDALALVLAVGSRKEIGHGMVQVHTPKLDGTNTIPKFAQRKLDFFFFCLIT